MKFSYCTPKKLPELQSVTAPDGSRYYVTPDGDKFPSVTTVVGAQKKEKILEWRRKVGEEQANKVSRLATSRGTNVHTLCERYLNNEDMGVTMPDALEMFRSIKPLLNRIDNIHYQEVALWSKKMKLAGRVDCIGEFDGVLSSIDFKTSKRSKTEEEIQDYFWQTAAYAIMYEELVGIPINQLVVIMAVEDEEPLLFVESTEDHIDGLVCAIKYYNLLHQKKS